MSQATRASLLRFALFAIGLFFVVGVGPMMLVIWPSGWSWGSDMHSHYPAMIIGVYATLGVFLIMAAKNPHANASLIWFTIWSSLVHAGIMTYQALTDAAEHENLVGDIPALYLVAIVLGLLMLINRE
ncbi:MAG: hypothetical protein JSR78_10740 [Proteobacteria bacterium]|nr:hypothetical protein [Pseudomonadota bacterium]